MGGKKARNNFSTKTRIVPAKKLGKNRPKKEQNHAFYIQTQIVTNKWEKTRETIFPETHE